ncbi:MAG: radical SAM family heme chaperone HemW [Pseudomonadota bacterium]
MRPLGLYIHWPFCARVCPYCDFTVARNRQVDAEAWAHAFEDDLKRLADIAEPCRLSSIYFGGGTPSLMPLDIAGRIFDVVEQLFGLVENAEITLEANPTDTEQFSSFRCLGVNRLSLGVQSFDDDELMFLGRNHDGAAARQAVDAALRCFPRVSADLIYALPEQTIDRWAHALDHAMGLGVQHWSLYQLTIEPRTAFGKAAARGELVPVTDDRAADFYELTTQISTAAGLPAYEVSSHAKPGYEAIHNGLYWDNADWLAVGPGAHGRFGPPTKRLATEGTAKATSYPTMDTVERLSVESLSLKEHRLEVLASGLRPLAGLDLARLGSDAEAVAQRARRWVDDGFLILQANRLAATMKGRLVLDYLAADLASFVSGDAAFDAA